MFCRKQLLAGRFLPVAIAFILGFSLASILLQEPHQNDQIITKLATKANDTATFLTILIFSAPKNAKRRQAIRSTWLKFTEDDRRRIEYHFVIGTSGLPVDAFEALNTEHGQHEDLLLLPYLTDSYDQLTSKLLESFKWLSRLNSFEFLLKVDDDSFVRLDALYDEMVEKDRANSQAQKYLYWGYFDGRAHVKRAGPWAESDWFLCDRYLPYALGGGYILARSLVDYLVLNAHLLKHYKSEDVSLGVWLAPLAPVTRVHDIRFDTEFKSRGCIDTHLISHKQSVVEMKSKYASLTSGGQERLCGQGETERRLAYEYNWKVPPSKCCTRNVTMIS